MSFSNSQCLNSTAFPARADIPPPPPPPAPRWEGGGLGPRGPQGQQGTTWSPPVPAPMLRTTANPLFYERVFSHDELTEVIGMFNDAGFLPKKNPYGDYVGLPEATQAAFLNALAYYAGNVTATSRSYSILFLNALNLQAMSAWSASAKVLFALCLRRLRLMEPGQWPVVLQAWAMQAPPNGSGDHTRRSNLYTCLGAYLMSGVGTAAYSSSKVREATVAIRPFLKSPALAVVYEATVVVDRVVQGNSYVANRKDIATQTFALELGGMQAARRMGISTTQAPFTQEAMVPVGWPPAPTVPKAVLSWRQELRLLRKKGTTSYAWRKHEDPLVVGSFLRAVRGAGKSLPSEVVSKLVARYPSLFVLQGKEGVASDAVVRRRAEARISKRLGWLEEVRSRQWPTEDKTLFGTSVLYRAYFNVDVEAFLGAPMLQCLFGGGFSGVLVASDDGSPYVETEATCWSDVVHAHSVLAYLKNRGILSGVGEQSFLIRSFGDVSWDDLLERLSFTGAMLGKRFPWHKGGSDFSLFSDRHAISVSSNEQLDRKFSEWTVRPDCTVSRGGLALCELPADLALPELRLVFSIGLRALAPAPLDMREYVFPSTGWERMGIQLCCTVPVPRAVPITCDAQDVGPMRFSGTIGGDDGFPAWGTRQDGDMYTVTCSVVHDFSTGQSFSAPDNIVWRNAKGQWVSVGAVPSSRLTSSKQLQTALIGGYHNTLYSGVTGSAQAIILLGPSNYITNAPQASSALCGTDEEEGSF